MFASSRSLSSDIERAPRVFAQVAIGDRLPDLPFEIKGADIVRFAGAVDDYADPHWNHPFMVAHGLPGVIVHGWFTFSVMCKVVEQWFPPQVADYREFSVRYTRTNLAGNGRYAASVREKSVANGEQRVMLDLWAENDQGQRMAEGSVTVVLV
jgi:acyl dehydratase